MHSLKFLEMFAFVMVRALRRARLNLEQRIGRADFARYITTDEMEAAVVRAFDATVTELLARRAAQTDAATR